MAKSLKGTKTEKNLIASFAGESQARNRYSYYASAAKKDGYKQIEAIFQETADNEKEHAKRFFKLLVDGLGACRKPVTAKVEAEYPVELGNTLDNLRAAAEGENEEHTKLYPEAAKIADDEGFPEIAAQFRKIAEVEVAHEIRYLKLAANIENGKVFKKETPVKWKCRNCGYIHEGAEAPEKCPTCLHPRDYFELQCENY
ncbi:MAG: rubrerythrin family protein [bacterium]|nr:rubrerythrin family protein [bacterium]